MPALIALSLAPSTASALHWHAAAGPGQAASCLADLEQSLPPEPPGIGTAPVSGNDRVASSPDGGSATQSTAEVGERADAHIDSGAHAADGGSHTRVFDEIVEVEGAPWLRLHFEDVVLERGDRIEISAADSAEVLDVLTRRDFRDGTGASRYLGSSSVSVALLAGPAARASRFVVVAIQYGYARDTSLVPTPRAICDLRDERVASYDDRVCMLFSERAVCGMNTSVECWCPSDNGSPPRPCVHNRCQGGSRAGLACGDVVCPVANPTDPRCVARTFIGTAFFIEPGINRNLCLLTAGHNMFQEGNSNRRQRNLSSMLICGVYGCGLDSKGGAIDCDMATHTCPSGPRAGKPCTDPTLGGPLEQYPARLLDGEQLAPADPDETGAPHDWALLQVRPGLRHNAFGLSDAFGEFEGTAVIGHGTDTGPTQMDMMQQSASGKAIRQPDSDVVNHFIDTDHGNSGSPVIMYDGSVLGIHVEGPGAYGECRTADNPNNAVFVHHDHRAGDPGRSLEAALKRCPGRTQASAHVSMKKRIENDPIPGARVAYEIKITGKGLETNRSVLRDTLPPELVFESVQVDPPQVLETPNPIPAADGVLSLGLAPYRGTIFVHLVAHIRRSATVGTVITNRADLRLASGVVASSTVRFTIVGVDRGAAGLSLRLVCPDHVGWDFAKNRSADVSCELIYADVSDPSIAGNTSELTLALPIDEAGKPIFKVLIPGGLAGGVLNGDSTKITWKNLTAPGGKLRIRGSFDKQPEGPARWSAALIDNNTDSGVRKIGDVIALTEVGLRLDLQWEVPPTPASVRPGAARYSDFRIAYSGLRGNGTIDLNFCIGGPLWQVALPVTLDSRLSAAQQSAVEVVVSQKCLVSVRNLPPTQNALLLLEVSARLDASTPAGPVRTVTAQITDSGRSGPAATASISREISTP